MCCDVCFSLNVHILRAIETRRTAGSDAVSAEYLYSFLFECFVSDEIVEIVGGQIGDHAAIC